ncbi:MAG: hypothetical protein V1817_03000, partial [Candidatus Micrarchaeota archaeon]
MAGISVKTTLAPHFRIVFIAVVLLALAAGFSGFARAANLSTEQQLDVLAARISANENAVFNESNASATGIVFDKQGFGPYHSIF